MSDQLKKNSAQEYFISFIKKKSKLLIGIISIALLVFSISIFFNNKEKNKNILVSEQFNQAKILIQNNKNNEAKIILEKIVAEKNKFYSPLSLYLLIDKEIETNNKKIIVLFDKILLIKKIDEEDINLIKIKKALFLSDSENEQLLLDTLNPIINSDSIWNKKAAKYLSDYFFQKGEKSKSNEYRKIFKGMSKK
ncbi:MAG: hypothetical protein FD547_000141 [Pelagibacterales bacterium]|jgi:predicted negative regulator of RcsB-dependent stress response|nr:hypothetical protein [Pelagibacterales bacterium]